jgi:hypothetical protein
MGEESPPVTAVPITSKASDVPMAWESLVSRLTQADGYLAVKGVRLRRPAAALTAALRLLCDDSTLYIAKSNGIGENMNQSCRTSGVAVVLLIGDNR